jgi:hypothetical protein
MKKSFTIVTLAILAAAMAGCYQTPTPDAGAPTKPAVSTDATGNTPTSAPSATPAPNAGKGDKALAPGQKSTTPN